MQKILKLILQPLNKLKKSKLQLHQPDVIKSDIQNFKICLKEKNVSAAGNFVSKFENEIKKITKSKYVVCTNSGTSALHIAYILSDIQKNDEVLCPAFTFVATANAILYCNAIPHFIEIEPKYFGVDFKKLEEYLKINTFVKNNRTYNKKTKRIIKALVVVHPLGYPADCDKIKYFAKKFNLNIIEDAADSLGSYFEGKHVGNFGDIGVLSFNGNKILTTGLGGAIITNNKLIAKRAQKLINVSKIPHRFKLSHSSLGYNYRLANLNAALGLSQIKRFHKTLQNKKKIFKFYFNFYKQNKYFDLIQESNKKKFNYWLQTILIKKKYKFATNKILNFLIKKKIFVRQGWELMTNLKHLRKFPKMRLLVAKSIQTRIINLPSSTNILKS